MPLWIKLAWTAFLLVLIPVYWIRYGPKNFLWFSDIALFGTCLGLWLEQPLLLSMAAVGVLLPECLWIASFLARLATGRSLSSLADYMFDAGRPRYLRALSLFHLALPPVLLWALAELGYDPRALPAQTVLAWLVLPLTYAVADPAGENINWVFGFGKGTQKRSLHHLALLMVGFPLAIFLPTHFVLQAFF